MTTLPPDTNPAPDELPETASDAPLPSPDQSVPRRQRRRRSSAIEPNQEVSDSPAPAPSSVPAKAESSEPEPVELIASTTASDGSEEDDPSDDCQDIPKNQSFVFVENIEWTLSRLGKSHKIHLIQSGRDVTGHYTEINNDSQFHGTVTRATRNSDAILVEFTQTSPTSDYRATQTGQVVHPYLVTGDWEDNRGNQGRFTLQGRAIPAPVAPEVGLDKEPESPQPVDLSQLPEIQRLKEMARLYPELLHPELADDDEDEEECWDSFTDWWGEPPTVGAEWQWVLTASSLQNADLKGAKLAGANLRDRDLSGVDLSEADLRHCDLTDAKLTGATLKRAVLNHANLTRTDLQGANLERSHLAHAILNRTNLEAAQLIAADLERANLYNPKINGANFNQANLRYTSLEIRGQQVNFICAHFDGAEVPHSFGLHHCDCRWATFRHVIFSRSRDENEQIDDRGLGMSQCNLQHTDWLGADLNGFEFQTSILRHSRFDRADLDDAEFMQCDLQEVDLSQATELPTFKECDLSRANLRGQQGNLELQQCNLSGADLIGFTVIPSGRWCDLSGVQIDASTQWDARWQVIWEVQNQGRKHDLVGADLRRMRLMNLDLSGADLSGADLSYAQVYASVNLEGANLTGANLTNTWFFGTNLSHADLRQAHWEQYSPRFESCNLAHARLDGLKLRGRLSGQLDLSGVNLANMDLSRSQLRKAKLHNTILTNANLAQVDFREVDLTGADLSGANLTKADLCMAKLTDADLSNADLTEANLYQTNRQGTNLTGALLQNTKSDKTVF